MAFVLVEQFFGRSERRELLKFVLAQEAAFRPSVVYGPLLPPRVDDRERRSRSVEVGPHAALFEEAVTARLPGVLASLGYRRFEPSHIDVGATAYCDGDYFRMHHDGDEVNRPISFVYFCHREPKAFSGGELRIRADSRSDAPSGESEFDVVTPVANAAVFFPSGVRHEVLPVAVPSKRFEDSRLTFHGWARRDNGNAGT